MTTDYTTPSDAAKEYATGRGHKDCADGSFPGQCSLIPSFDAGAAHERATRAPEPIRLTDPEDPRWRDGAKVRGEFDNGTVIEGPLLEDGGLWFICYGVRDPGKWYVNLRENIPAVYLIAEAPDPDAELVAALVESGIPETTARVHIMATRAAGLDIVKRPGATFSGQGVLL